MVETAGRRPEAQPDGRFVSGLLAPFLFAWRFLRFIYLTLRKAWEDEVLQTSSSLAFVTILSLVPLFAAFSFVGARMFNQYEERSLEVFIQILPYSESTIVEKIQGFLAQAESLRGIGLFAFLVTSLMVFGAIEQTINRVWRVSKMRPLRVRLFSFTLLLFWGPLLLGATFSSLLLLRQSPRLRSLFAESLLLASLPFLATLLGLTMLYWLVPYTHVRFRSALTGGLIAALLLEGLRRSFGLFVDLAKNINVVYGSFAFAVLFMLSIEITWLIVLLGSEAAYAAQHFRALERGLARYSPFHGRWVGLAALATVADGFARGEPTISHDALAERLRLTPDELARIVQPLLDHDLLHETKGDQRIYVLGRDPRHLHLDALLEAYEPQKGEAFEAVPQALQERLEALRQKLHEARHGRLDGLSVADLMEGGARRRSGTRKSETGRDAVKREPTSGAAEPMGEAPEPAETGAEARR